jgi:hypothetical protein
MMQTDSGFAATKECPGGVCGASEEATLLPKGSKGQQEEGGLPAPQVIGTNDASQAHGISPDVSDKPTYGVRLDHDNYEQECLASAMQEFFYEERIRLQGVDDDSEQLQRLSVCISIWTAIRATLMAVSMHLNDEGEKCSRIVDQPGQKSFRASSVDKAIQLHSLAIEAAADVTEGDTAEVMRAHAALCKLYCEHAQGARAIRQSKNELERCRNKAAIRHGMQVSHARCHSA